jgi:hypothetical protein
VPEIVRPDNQDPEPPVELVGGWLEGPDCVLMLRVTREGLTTFRPMLTAALMERGLIDSEGRKVGPRLADLSGEFP